MTLLISTYIETVRKVWQQGYILLKKGFIFESKDAQFSTPLRAAALTTYFWAVLRTAQHGHTTHMASTLAFRFLRLCTTAYDF